MALLYPLKLWLKAESPIWYKFLFNLKLASVIAGSCFKPVKRNAAMPIVLKFSGKSIYCNALALSKV
jgi:hypothetical protein